MPSTYTANTGLEKPGSGEQAGSWGVTANENFDIIDRAVNGVGSISLSGTSSTLTTTSGALSDGQYKVLVLGGAPTGTHTVTVAPNDSQHVYIVKNASGQTVTFTQGSGSNVSVLNGTNKIIYCDGAGSGASVADITQSLDLNTLTVNGTSVTATAAELNILDGVTASTVELNYVDGVTSNIQTQLNAATAATAAVDAYKVPAGGIIMWSGSTGSIPSGWFLCNGSNGTPDLRNRFVVGAGGSYGVGATGGADSVTLSTSQIPAHSHSGSTSSAGGHNHTFSGTTSEIGDHTHDEYHYHTNGSGDGPGPGASCCGGAIEDGGIDTGPAGSHNHTFSGTTSSAGAHTHTVSVGNTGGGASHENRPPYYALAYIMKS